MVFGVASIMAKIDATNVKAVACGAIIGAQLAGAVPVASATLTAAASVGGSVGM